MKVLLTALLAASLFVPVLAFARPTKASRACHEAPNALGRCFRLEHGGDHILIFENDRVTRGWCIENQGRGWAPNGAANCRTVGSSVGSCFSPDPQLEYPWDVETPGVTRSWCKSSGGRGWSANGSFPRD